VTNTLDNRRSRPSSSPARPPSVRQRVRAARRPTPRRCSPPRTGPRPDLNAFARLAPEREAAEDIVAEAFLGSTARCSRRMPDDQLAVAYRSRRTSSCRAAVG